MRRGSEHLLVVALLTAGCTDVGIRFPGSTSVDTDLPPVVDVAPPLAICGALPSTTAPLEPVELVGENSYDPDGIDLIDHRWTLVTQPVGSVATLPRIAGDSPNREGFVPDVVGTYTATLVVTNDRGNQSTTCATSFDATPTKRLWVELYWQYEGDNLDLHLVRDVPNANRDDDCWAGNCLGGLDWGVAGETADDPVLGRDDVEGTGPEAGGIEEPASGSYLIAVTDDDSLRLTADNVATVIVWIDGVEAWRGTHTFSVENGQKTLARVAWPSGQVTPL